MPDILIADDHPLFRDALQRAVMVAVPKARVHAAEGVHDLLGLIEQYPDAELLLLDLHMPGARGYSALAHIRGQYPGLPTIVVSGHEEAQVARRALAHGASAYIPKSTSSDHIVEAIRAVLDGDIWLPHTLPGSHGELLPDEAEAAAMVASLTPQQFRVMTMIAEGLLNKQIAYELGVSEATVKAHMTAIMRKLKVNNRTQVALIASQLAVDQESMPPLPDERTTREPRQRGEQSAQRGRSYRFVQQRIAKRPRSLFQFAAAVCRDHRHWRQFAVQMTQLLQCLQAVDSIGKVIIHQYQVDGAVLELLRSFFDVLGDAAVHAPATEQCSHAIENRRVVVEAKHGQRQLLVRVRAAARADDAPAPLRCAARRPQNSCHDRPASAGPDGGQGYRPGDHRWTAPGPDLFRPTGTDAPAAGTRRRCGHVAPAAIPGPVSQTSMRTSPPARRAPSSTPPVAV